MAGGPPQIISPFCGELLPPAKMSWTAFGLIALFGASMMLPGLGQDYRALTEHEVINVQPAREMLSSGDWIVLRIAGRPIPEAKGPLPAWLIAVCMFLTQSEGEWVARAVGVLAAIWTALMIASLAARWYGHRVGLIAGLVQLSMVYVLKIARLAECDVFLMCTVVAALYCFGVANVDSPRGKPQSRWYAIGFFLATGLSFLCKTFVGPGLIGCACFFYILARRDWSLLRFFLSPVGWLLFAACTLIWPVAYYLAHPEILQYLAMHYLHRAGGAMGGVKPFYYYCLGLPLMTLPWFPLLVLALWVGVRRGLHRDPLWQFIAAWVVPAVVLFSFSACKYDHYLAPLLPPLSILITLGLMHYLSLRFNNPGRGTFWFGAATLVGMGMGLIAVLRLRPLGYTAIAALLALATVGCLAMLLFEQRRWLNAYLGTMFATIWLATIGVFCWVFPYHDFYRPHREFVARINAQVPQGTPVHFVELAHQIHVYYLNRPVHFVGNLQELQAEFSGGEKEVFMVAPRDFVKSCEPRGTVEVLDQCPAHSLLPDARRPLFCRVKNEH